jgi:hypothetical protein
MKETAGPDVWYEEECYVRGWSHHGPDEWCNLFQGPGGPILGKDEASHVTRKPEHR